MADNKGSDGGRDPVDGSSYSFANTENQKLHNLNENEEDFFGIDFLNSTPIPENIRPKVSLNHRILASRKNENSNPQDENLIEWKSGRLKSNESGAVGRMDYFTEEMLKSYGEQHSKKPLTTNEQHDVVEHREVCLQRKQLLNASEMDYFPQQLIPNSSSETSVPHFDFNRSNMNAEDVRSPGDDSNCSVISSSTNNDYWRQRQFEREQFAPIKSKDRVSVRMTPRDSIDELEQMSKKLLPPAASSKRSQIQRDPLDTLDESGSGASNSIVDRGGLGIILSMIDSVWKLSGSSLVDLLCSNILYDDDDVIAFNKPYQIAYSGAPLHQAQFDRIIQSVKQIVAPKIGRLHLIKSLDKDLSGIIVFGKNALIHSEMKEKYEKGLVEQRFHVIVKGVPKEKRALINIPLVKTLHGRNVTMRPFFPGPGIKKDSFNAETEYRVVKDNMYCALLECVAKNDVLHQIRSHLGFGIGHPILGDAKYNFGAPTPPALPSQVYHLLNMRAKDFRRLPMYIHLKDVRFSKDTSKDTSIICIRANYPKFFAYTMRKLKLLR